MDISHLNKQQQLAVCSTEGKVRVIAGAGTGKTLVLVNRYAYIVNELGVDPNHVLCLTFTNKAAKEMRIRLADKFRINIKDSYMGTLHGFCLKFLRENYAEAGLSPHFLVMDREDCISLAKDIIKGKRGAKGFVYEVSEWKYSIYNEYLSIINNARKQGKDNSFSNPIRQFVSRQQELNMLDYDDLILYTYSILRSNKEIECKWAEKFDYIMVDEAQDCSFIDWAIINHISSASGNLFVVGDPDQCIYQWRGAAPKYLVDFKPNTDIVLNENYRSTQSILDVANDIIACNKMRVPKNLYSTIGNSPIPTYFYLQDDIKEGKKIASTILEEHKNIEYGQMAVLYRNSSVSHKIERALINAKIPYTIWGGVRFYERKEIKDILCYLRLITSKENLAFNRIVNVPSRHIGPVSFDVINKVAKEHNTNLFDAISFVNLSGERQKNLVEFQKNINDLIECANKISVTELIGLIVEKFHLNEWYGNEKERLDNIDELKHSAKLYVDEMKKQNKPYSLNSFLQDVSLYTNIDQDFTNDAVRLMTIHQSKGLEFSCVFVCGLTECILPSRRTLEESGEMGLEEERRLMYVALTRAREKLYLTASRGYSYYGENRQSRFISEIRQEHLTIYADNESTKNESCAHKKVGQDILTNSIFGPYDKGDVVRHYKYGVCIFDRYIDDNRCIIIQNDKPMDVIVYHLFKINKANYNFVEGQWVEDDKYGRGMFIRDVDALSCIIRSNGQEYYVPKYGLSKVNINDLSKNSKRFKKGDVVKYNNTYIEVYESCKEGMKYHVDDNPKHDGLMQKSECAIRLIMSPVKDCIYWHKDNNVLNLFAYKETTRDSNGILFVGENVNGEKMILTAEDFCKSKYTILKQNVSVLKAIYAKISDEEKRIVKASDEIINNPLLKSDAILKGDIIKIGNRYFSFLTLEKGKIYCKKLSTNKEFVFSETTSLEIIARPYANMFYKSKNKYFYFNGFRTFASNLCFYGVSVERGKCTTSYIGISQIERKGFSPCSEKEFWENCKDKVGYVTYRYNIK